MGNKQREKIYRKAAKQIANCIDGNWAACIRLRSISGVNSTIWGLRNYFPEFYLFEQTTCVWWETQKDNKFDNECRVIALLLSAEMCKA